MPTRLNFVTALTTCYTVNLNGRNYTAVIDQNNKVTIQEKTNDFKTWQQIKAAVLNIHTL